MGLSSLTKYIPSPFPQLPEEIQNQRRKELQIRKLVPTTRQEETEARSYNHLAARLGQHWSSVGATGTGKTRFCLGVLEFYRRQYPRAYRYVLNSTHDDMPEVHAPQVHRGDRSPDVLSSPTYTQVWEPDEDSLEAYNAWMLKILYARKPAIVVIDEVASLGGDSRFPAPLRGHTLLLKQGRKHGITVLNGIQEIAKAPPSMFRQMTWFAQFRLVNDPYEQAMARRFLDVLKENHRQPSAKYGFHLKRMDGAFPAKEYRNMQELLQL